MANLESEIDRITKENSSNEFDILICSIIKDGNSTYYQRLLQCKKFSDYELAVLEKINKHSRKIDRLVSYEYCRANDLLPPINENELYFSNLLKDNLDMFLDTREREYSADTLSSLSSQILKDGIPKNAESTVIKAVTKSKNFEYETGLEEFESKYKDKSNSFGFPTGVEEIDKITGGLHLGTVNTIMGYAGSGKTTWGVNIAYNAALGGHNVAYFSLEINKYHLQCDLLSRHSNETRFKDKLEHRDLKFKKLDTNKEDYLFSTVFPHFSETVGKHLFIIDEGDILEYSTVFFEEFLRELDTKFIKETGKGIELIFVDHIQLLKSSNSTKVNDTREIINYFVSFFRKQAVNFLGTGRVVCVVLLSQTNRDGWRYATKHEGTYQLNALAESNELERSCNTVLSIYTNEAFMQSKQAKVMVVKSRDGALMEEPVSTYINPATYIIGDFVGEVAEETASFGMSDLFSDESDNSDLEQFNSKLGEPIWDD